MVFASDVIGETKVDRPIWPVIFFVSISSSRVRIENARCQTDAMAITAAEMVGRHAASHQMRNIGLFAVAALTLVGVGAWDSQAGVAAPAGDRLNPSQI